MEAISTEEVMRRIRALLPGRQRARRA
jgi:hypothetical protein